MKSIEQMMKKAVIEMMLLNLLSKQDMYGYELTQTLKLQSSGQLTIKEGSMYPILYRLMDAGHISCYEKLVGRRMTRIYYHLEASGFDELNKLQDSFHEYVNLIEQTMKAEIPENVLKVKRTEVL